MILKLLEVPLELFLEVSNLLQVLGPKGAGKPLLLRKTGTKGEKAIGKAPASLVYFIICFILDIFYYIPRMSEDKELEILKQKKIKELMERIENKNKQVNPKNILISRLVDRGDEVLRIAETYYPKETERIVNQLIEMIKNGKINNSIWGGELLAVFRNAGLRITVPTSISVSKDGKMTSLSDKLKGKKE